MRTIKLHQPTGHPYWQKNEFKIEMPDGSFFDIDPLFNRHGNYGGYEIIVHHGNIYFVQCSSSSGQGKQRLNDVKKIIDLSEYDNLEYIGEPLEMSNTLRNDISTMNWKDKA